jgi:uncharacterized protein DUF4190
MKRCPTCQKTFDDNMRFCQADGTPLVEDATPSDPYKTMVASREDIQAALSAPAVANEPSQARIGAPEEEPLEIPSNPPQSTPASEFETKIAGRDVIEIPPLAETAPPEPPKFSEPSAPPPSFGRSAPASPFSKPEPAGPGDFPTTPPIPSPFSSPKPASFEPPSAVRVPEPEPIPVAEEEERTYFEPEPAAPSFSPPEPTPATPQFAEPEPARAQPFSPFEAQSSPQSAAIAQSEWTPPPSPVQSNPAMSSPPPAAQGTKVNQTLPIVSLVFGIISLCCYVSPITGIVALITGFLGLRNIKSNPAQYGGKALALVGMILGGLMFLVGIAYIVFLLFFGGMGMIMQMLNQG